MSNIIETLLEVDIIDPDNFLKIKETLERIGIISHNNKTLYQSCHILHKQGKYYIVHFKELFMLDGRRSDLTEDDIDRRNAIAQLLEQWQLCKIVSTVERKQVKNIGVLPYSVRKDKSWKLVSKITVGGKKHVSNTR